MRVQEGLLLMTQTDRDRLVTLKKAKKRLITQREAAAELELSVRQVKRLLFALKKLIYLALSGLKSCFTF